MPSNKLGAHQDQAYDEHTLYVAPIPPGVGSPELTPMFSEVNPALCM